ncbi:ABC transporter permease [Fodinicola feengrottensis]|uniref:ABC transporter permease n=1 Tax=Fodinicola feengrottensis TaxID=435914 RepID=UPI0036F26FB4
MTRAVTGFAVATVIGGVVGIAVVRVKALRAAIGSLITGLQTLPSIAWFPLAILLFQLSEQAILFVIVLGAAPSIANGLINGVDYVPPLLKRVGQNLGAKGFSLFRYVILPAALPSCVAGLKQGWAFAWRSLMAGELLVIVEGRPSIGAELQHARDQIQPEIVIALLIIILIIGIAVGHRVFLCRPDDPGPVGDFGGTLVSYGREAAADLLQERAVADPGKVGGVRVHIAFVRPQCVFPVLPHPFGLSRRSGGFLRRGGQLGGLRGQRLICLVESVRVPVRRQQLFVALQRCSGILRERILHDVRRVGGFGGLVQLPNRRVERNAEDFFPAHQHPAARDVGAVLPLAEGP